jgi:WD40 repeat protein
MNGRMRVWNVARDKWANALPGHKGITRGLFLRDGRIVTLDTDDIGLRGGDLRSWSAASHELAGSTRVSWDASVEPSFSGDGRSVAVATSVYDVSIIDMTTGQLIASKHVEKKLDRVALSPDGDRLAVATRDGTLRLASIKGTGEELTASREPSVLMGSLSYSPRGDELLWASGPEDARIIDTREPVRPESRFRVTGRSPCTQGMADGC